jgi:hypothetical protein
MGTVAADLMLNIRAKTSEFRTGVDAAKKSAQNMGKELSKSLKGAGNQVSSALSQMTGGFSNMASGALSALKSIGMGFKTLQAAIMSTGIGALVIAIVVAISGLVAAFKRSESASTKMKEGMAFLGGMFDYLIGQLVKLGEWLVRAFSDPKQAILDLWEVIKTSLVNRFKGLIQLFTATWDIIKNGALAAGYAIKGIFDKEARKKAKEYFKGVVQGAKDVGEALLMITTGATLDDVKELANAMVESGKQNMAVTKMEIALIKQKIKDTTELASMDADIAKKREQLAELSTKSEEDRQKRLELINQILEGQDALAKRRISYAEQELALQISKTQATAGDTSLESQQKIAELQAKVDDERRKASQEKMNFLRQEQRIQQQIAEAELKALEEKQKLEKDIALSIRKLNEETSVLSTRDSKEAALKKLQYEKAAALEAARTAEETYALQQNYLVKLAILEDKFREEALAAEKEALRQRREMVEMYSDAVVMGLDAVAGFQRAAMERQLAAAGDDVERREAIERKFARRQKTISIAQAMINTALSVTKALTAAAPPLNYILAAANAAAGAAQIAVIKSVPLAKGGIAYGETLATVGEYTGARHNPEVISPLKDLKNLLGLDSPMSGEVKFVIEGNTLAGILNNQRNKNIYF